MLKEPNDYSQNQDDDSVDMISIISKEVKAVPESKSKRSRSIAIALAIITVSSIATILAVWSVGLLDSSVPSYTPPTVNSVIYGIFSGKPSEDSFNSSNQTLINHKELTFLILENYNQSILEILIIDGHWTNGEERNLRQLEKIEEDFESEYEEMNPYLAFVNVKDGTIQKLMSSQGSNDENGENIASYIKMFLLNTHGEKLTRSLGDGKVCEFHGVEYCPNFSKIDGESHIMIIAEYTKEYTGSSRRTSSLESSFYILEQKISKKSFINRISGELEAAHFTGYTTVPILSGPDNVVANFTIDHEIYANFTVSSDKLTDAEKKKLKKELLEKYNFEPLDLLGSNNTGKLKSFNISSLDPTDEFLPPDENHDTSLNNNNRLLSESNPRELLLNNPYSIKILSVMGVNIYFNMKVEEFDTNRINVTNELAFESDIKVPFGMYQIGNDAVNLTKRLITLKNIFETNVLNLTSFIDSYVNVSYKGFQNTTLIKLAEIQKSLIYIETKLVGLMQFINLTSANFASNVRIQAKQHRTSVQYLIRTYQSDITKANNDIENINKLIISTNDLKEKSKAEFALTNQTLNEIITNALSEMLRTKESLTASLNTNQQTFDYLKSVETAYSTAKSILQSQNTSIHFQIAGLQILYDNINSQLVLITNDKAQITNYISVEFPAFKNKTDEKVISLNQQLAEIALQIKSATDTLNSLDLQLRTYQNQLSEILSAFRTTSYTDSEIAQKEQLEKKINEIQTQIAASNSSYQQMLYNQSQIQNASNEYNEYVYSTYRNQIITWRNQTTDYIQNKLQIPLIQVSILRTNISSHLTSLNSTLNDTKTQLLKATSSYETALLYQKTQLEIIIADRARELSKYDNISSDYNKQLLSAQTLINNFNKELNKTTAQIEQEFQIQKNTISTNIASVNSQIDNLQNYILPDLKEKLKVAEEDPDSQEQAKKLRDQIEASNSLIQLLTTQKQGYETTLKSMIISYTNILPTFSASFSTFITSSQKLLNSSLTSLNQTTTNSTALISTFSDKIDYIDKTVEQTITSNITAVNQTITILRSNLTSTQNSIDNLDARISNLTSELQRLNNTIREIEINLTNYTNSVANKKTSINLLTSSINSLNETLQSLDRGDYDWTDFFANHGFFEIRKTLYDSVAASLEQVYNDTVVPAKNLTLLVQGFNNFSSFFLENAITKALEMQTARANISILPNSEKITSGAKLLNFSLFDSSVTKIKNTHKLFQNNVTYLLSQLNSSVPQSISKLSNITNSSDYIKSISMSLEYYKSLEKEFKVKFDLDDFQNITIAYIQNRLCKEMNDSIISLSIVKDLNQTANNYSSKALNPVLDTQLFKGTFINLMGPVKTTTIMQFNKIFKLEYQFPTISTPVRPINGNLRATASIKVDNQTIVSSVENTFALIPSVILEIAVDAGYRTVDNGALAYARIKTNFTLPVKSGYNIPLSEFALQGTSHSKSNGYADAHSYTSSISCWRSCSFWRCKRKCQRNYSPPKFVSRDYYDWNVVLPVFKV